MPILPQVSEFEQILLDKRHLTEQELLEVKEIESRLGVEFIVNLDKPYVFMARLGSKSIYLTSMNRFIQMMRVGFNWPREWKCSLHDARRATIQEVLNSKVRGYSKGSPLEAFDELNSLIRKVEGWTGPVEMGCID